MKRRDFVVASGSTILSGIGIGKIQNAALGLEFKISIPDGTPSNIDSILLNFEKLEITPHYIDDNQDINLTVEVEAGNDGINTKSSNISVVNGVTEEVSNRFNPLLVDNFSSDPEYISGRVKVTVDHSSVSDQYQQSFIISEPDYPDVALNFDGLDDTVEIDTVTDFRPNTGFTMSHWIKKTGSESSYASSFVNADTSGTSRDYNGFKNADNGSTIRFVVGRSDNTEFTQTTFGSISNDVWHHVAGVYDQESREITLFVDGDEVDSSSVTWADSLDLLQYNRNKIGGHREDSTYWDGWVDDARIYDKRLTKGDVRDLYDLPYRDDVSPENLVGWWIIKEGSGNEVVDESGNGNNGSITGADWVKIDNR